MPKFTDRERDLIRQQLIDACKACWTRFGYHKTGIRELTQMAAISTGTFYRFFDSKELLFLAVAEEFQEGLIRQFHDHMRANPDKQGLAAGLKDMAAAMSDVPWLTAMWDDWPVIARKLPDNYLEQDFRTDVVRIGGIVRQYQLTSRCDTETLTTIIDILMVSVTRVTYLPRESKAAVGFIIDAIVNELFE